MSRLRGLMQRGCGVRSLRSMLGACAARSVRARVRSCALDARCAARSVLGSVLGVRSRRCALGRVRALGSVRSRRLQSVGRVDLLCTLNCRKALVSVHCLGPHM